MSKTKFAIGCLVQWYEVEMVSEYIETLNEAINEYDGNVLVDVTLVMNQDLEKTSLDRIEFLNIKDRVKRLFGKNVNYRDTAQLHTIADYRREFNERYSDEVDVLVWGESDMLVPKQMFTSLDTLHQNVDTPKYLATFGICKMWDSSWDPLVHVDYRDIKFIDDENGHLNPNQAKSPMSIEKMNEINGKVEEFDFSYIQYPKISGACLVFSSDLIKSGVNIPPCMLYNDDEGLSIMSQKMLGQNYLQFVCQNILHVHARRHPQKRMYVKDEDNSYSFIGDKNDSFQKFLKMSKENIQILMTGNGKFKEYNDLKNELELK